MPFKAAGEAIHFVEEGPSTLPSYSSEPLQKLSLLRVFNTQAIWKRAEFADFPEFDPVLPPIFSLVRRIDRWVSDAEDYVVGVCTHL